MAFFLHCKNVALKIGNLYAKTGTNGIYEFYKIAIFDGWMIMDK